MSGLVVKTSKNGIVRVISSDETICVHFALLVSERHESKFPHQAWVISKRVRVEPINIHLLQKPQLQHSWL